MLKLLSVFRRISTFSLYITCELLSHIYIWFTVCMLANHFAHFLSFKCINKWFPFLYLPFEIKVALSPIRLCCFDWDYNPSFAKQNPPECKGRKHTRLYTFYMFSDVFVLFRQLYLERIRGPACSLFLSERSNQMQFLHSLWNGTGINISFECDRDVSLFVFCLIECQLSLKQLVTSKMFNGIQ